jgi:hypothetical protein
LVMLVVFGFADAGVLGTTFLNEIHPVRDSAPCMVVPVRIEKH